MRFGLQLVMIILLLVFLISNCLEVNKSPGIKESGVVKIPVFQNATGTIITTVTGNIGDSTSSKPISPSMIISSYPRWDAEITYVENDYVSYDGVIWKAKWYTVNEKPGTTGEWGVWDYVTVDSREE